jgi:hypothetical protein
LGGYSRTISDHQSYKDTPPGEYADTPSGAGAFDATAPVDATVSIDATADLQTEALHP